WPNRLRSMSSRRRGGCSSLIVSILYEIEVSGPPRRAGAVTALRDMVGPTALFQPPEVDRLSARRKPARAADEGGGRLAQDAGHPLSGLDQRRQVVAGVEAGALQHVDEVLGADVAGGVGGEGAAAEAAAGGVQHVDARL